MARIATKRADDDSLAIRAAWLHFAAGLTQAEVAERLGVSNVKAHRLVSWASQSGAVKVTIDGDVTECLLLEERLCQRFGLAYAQVVPNLYEDGLPLRALGIAGAGYLKREIEGTEGRVIGIGHGRTLAAVISASPRIDCGSTRFVSLMGGLTRNYAANPHDVMHRLAERTGSAAYVLPVPFVANSASDREVLLSQRGVADVFALATTADLMIVGIGTTQPDAQLVGAGMIDLDEIREVQNGGGVGEILGHFFDRAGQPIDTSLAARTLSPDLAALRERRIVAIAGGPAKIEGIGAILRSGLLSGLLTDERTATALMERAEN
ncbi:sugar-binding transcriptional regulator [Aureimonas sp. N4]|uniref:sugar-binding transcriptional regulator n=1 Tax=Aureimonas sp. N4 TaxID=1638165 RepID=UPI00078449ED|nr:sugar-binding transcriptional regulator [Aureimonas sp. N4]